MRVLINWFYWNFNKYHWRVIKEAILGYPWDFDYAYRLERAKLDEMRHYFKHKGIAENRLLASIRIAKMIKMIDIFTERIETSSYNIVGDINTGKIEYKCLVNVNLKNIHRFIKEDENKNYYIQHPDEIYKLKAKHLYEKMRAEWMESFWD